jgi:superfamily II DNA or RNA helicase
MLRLEINNSYSKLSGMDLAQHRSLKAKLSYKLDPKASFFSRDHRGGVRTLLAKDGSFPTGLLGHAREWITASKLQPQLSDLRIVPKRLPGAYKPNWRGLSPYPEQMALVEVASARGQGTISAVTGFGKSIAMALLTQHFQVKTLIVVPNLNLKLQLRASFKSWFGSTPNITIENIDSPSLKKPGNYDLLLLDEAHHSAAATYRKLNKTAWKGIYYRFFFTATPFRNQEEEQMLMESITGPVIYEVDYRAAVDAGYIVPLECYYFECPPKTIDSNHWQTVYNALVTNNEPRNILIAKTLSNLNASGVSTLCLVKEVAHGQALADLTGLDFAHGTNPDTESLIADFSSGKIKTLIATTGVAGEGTDTRAAEYIVIAGLGKSRPALMQQCGRGFRRFGTKDSCKIILFRDKSHKWTLTHFKEQSKVIKEQYGAITTRI